MWVIRKALDPDLVNRYLRARDLIKDLLGESDLSERTAKPKVIVLDKEIKVEVSRVVIGRLTQTIVETTSKPIDKVVTGSSKTILYIYVADEKSYMSRLHTELVKGGRAVFEGHGLAKQNGGLKG